MNNAFVKTLSKHINTPRKFNNFNQQLIETEASFEPVKLNKVELKCGQLHLGNRGIYKAGMHFDFHRHSFLQFEIGVSGLYMFGLKNGQNVVMQPGQVLIFVPELAHNWRCVEDGIMLGMNLFIQGEQAKLLSSKIQSQSNGMPILLENAPMELVEDCLNSVIKRRSPLWRQYSASLLRAWTLDILPQAFDLSSWIESTDTSARLPREERLCRNVIEYIKVNSGNPLSMEEIASHVGVSARHLSRIFKHHYNTTPYNMLMETRLNQIYEALTQSNYRSVKELAYEHGFLSSSYFTSCFKKKFGMLPSQMLNTSKQKEK